MIRRSNWLILLTLLIMAVLTGLLARANAPPARQNATLTVIRDGSVLKVWTLEQIRALPACELSKSIRSSNHANESGVFRGVELNVLLNQTDLCLLADAQKILARAADGYTVTFSADEISLAGNILIAYSKDGDPLGQLAEGGTGPLRIVIRDDAFGTRGIKYLTEIEVD